MHRPKLTMFEACMITGFVILLASWIAMTWLAFSSLEVAQKALKSQKPTFTLSITNAP